MKKTAALCAIFILAAASGYAQFQHRFSMFLKASAMLASQNINDPNGNDSGPGNGFGNGKINASTRGPSSDDPDWDFGFGVNAVANRFGFTGSMSMMNFDVNANMWWYPIPEFLIKIGHVTSGHGTFTGAQLTAWHINATDIATLFPFYYYNGYAGTVLREGFGLYLPPSDIGRTTLTLNLFPLHLLGIYNQNSLAVRVAFPYFNEDFDVTYFEYFHSQIDIGIYGFGNMAFTYARPHTSDNKSYRGRIKHDFYAQLRKSMAGFNWEFGVNYSLVNKDIVTTHKREPVGIGVGWRRGNFWIGDPLVLTARLGLSVPLERKPPGRVLQGPGAEFGAQSLLNVYFPFAAADFVVNYQLREGLRLYLPVGVGSIIGDEFLFAWQFSPYIVKKLGGMDFYGGVQLLNNYSPPVWTGEGFRGPFTSLTTETMKRVRWAIPIAMVWTY